MNLKHIKTVTAGSDVSTLAIDDCFNSSYSHYKVFMDNLDPYGFVYFHGKLRDNSGAVSGTNYIQHQLGKFGTPGSGGGLGFYYAGYRSDLDYILYFAGQGINSYKNTIHGVWDFYMPFESDKFTFLTGKAQGSQAQYSLYASHQNAVYPVATSITGFEIYSTVSNKITTGTKFSVYGVPT